MGLDGSVGRSLEEVVALHHHFGLVHEAVHVPELQVDDLRDVAVVACLARLVNPRPLGGRQGGFRLQVGRELFVLDVDELEGVEGRVFVHGRDRSDAISDVAHAIQAQRILVRSPRDDSVPDRHVLAGDHGMNAGEGEGPASVHGNDARVGMGAPQDLPMKHAGQDDIVRVLCSACRLGQPVDLPLGVAYYV